MQRIRRSIVSLIGMCSQLWTFLLLLCSATILIFHVLEISTPSLLILPFCLFVPGYAFVAVFFSQLRNLERALMSIAFSVALFVGIKSFIQTFALMDIYSELSVVTILSAICLITKLIVTVKSGKS